VLRVERFFTLAVGYNIPQMVNRRLVVVAIATNLLLATCLLTTSYIQLGITVGLSMYRTCGKVAIVVIRPVRLWSLRDLNSIKAGDLVVLRRYQPFEFWLKRVKYRVGEWLWVEGEHPQSLDSRDIGWVSIFSVYGKVVKVLVVERPSPAELREIQLESRSN
jgi:hypothetical protein